MFFSPAFTLSPSSGRTIGSARTSGLKKLAFAVLLLSTAPLASAQASISVLTQHNDIGRTGQNTKETVLTPTNVSATNFGKLFTAVVDGEVYAQPLYMQNLTIPTKGAHNVVFVATENDSVYAFDADTNGGVNSVPLWEQSMAAPAHGAAPGATSVPSVDIGSDIQPTIGITGTPVIDPVSGTLFVVSFTLEKSAYVLRLHALKIASGEEERGSPVTISATCAGTGNGSSGGLLTFDAQLENQRPGLLLLDGVVYVGFAAHGDSGAWHGWMFAYNESPLTPAATYCASPDGIGSGFWMSGAGIAADTDQAATNPNGRLFVVTGNGDFSAANNDYGDSVLLLSLNNSKLAVGDSFTPFDEQYLDASDGDLGAGGAVIIPDADSTTPLLVTAGKEGRIYLLNRNNLGGFNSSTDQVVQEIADGSTSTTWGAGLWGLPAYWNKTIYYPGRNGPLQAFALANGLLSTAPIGKTTEILNYPAATPSVSANGNANGIVWLLETSNPNAPGAVLEAYNATNLKTLLYSSQTNATRDGLGSGVKFAVPTVANGKVYAASTAVNPITGTSYGQLSVYGLLAGVSTAATPAFDPGSESFPKSISVTITDATPGAAIYYTTDGSVPSGVSSRYSGPITVSANETITAIASATGYLESSPASAIYTSTSQVPNPTISAPSGIYNVSASAPLGISLADSLKSAIIYYTTDGSTPTASSKKYTGTIEINPPDSETFTLKVIGLASGLTASDVVSAEYGIDVVGTSVSFGSGFASAQGTGATQMTFNGSVALDDTRLQLTTGAFNQAGSAFVNGPLKVTSFTSTFTFQISLASGVTGADGLTFTLQGVGPTALGTNGSGLGYGSIDSSLALAFYFDGQNAMGVLVDGSLSPTVPLINLDGTGISLSSPGVPGDTCSVTLTYSNQNDTLGVTITDTVTGATLSTAFADDIQALTAGETAYLGFTGSTNANGSSSEKIETWTYTAGQPKGTVTAGPAFSVAAGTYATAQSVTITSPTAGAKIYYTTDGSNPTTFSTLYSNPVSVSSTETIHALALASGDLISPVATITYTINP